MNKTRLQEITHSPVFGGVLLFLSGLLAIVLDNTEAHYFYEHLLLTPFNIPLYFFTLHESLLFWINDAAMALFFLMVGLEIKREIYTGALSDPAQLLLPLVAAFGGVAVPAIIYFAINHHDPVALKGWAIPTATDIAFSLGILSLLGNRVSSELKVFLTALATIDDISAIVVIAIFYTSELSIESSLIAVAAIATLWLINRSKVTSLKPYLFVGFFLWLAVYQSGVHATLAGIVLAFAIPIESGSATLYSPLVLLEKKLFPWVTFLILPLFAFANSGFSIAGLTLKSLSNGVPLGIAVGLFVGKQLGIFSTSYLLIKNKFAQLPKDTSWAQMYGVAVICGVGFTMSLFIGALAFQDNNEYFRYVRIGVLVGSGLSGLFGYCLLRAVSPKRLA